MIITNYYNSKTSWADSILKEGLHYLNHILFGNFHCKTTNNTTKQNNGLIVYIHGLNSSTSDGNLYKRDIQQILPNEFEIFVPNVKRKGNCSLQEAAQPILEEIEQYIEKNPGKPIQLIGHSNGGRIAAYIETCLREKPVHIRLTGIAGAFRGSDTLALGNYLGISKLFVPKIVQKELKTNSETAIKLMNKMKEDIKVGSRTYTFYATTNDLAIPNIQSTHPNIGHHAEYVLLSHCGHSSIVSVVRPIE
ncbi:MAG: hypothetical protein FJZ43_04250, partial [Candidatus Staskawiczbacteria bacterium]|nr:hypothetical protein [Candidatus Staskawiczbacteria bacterium]